MPCLIVGRNNTEEGVPISLTLSPLVAINDEHGSILLIWLLTCDLDGSPYHMYFCSFITKEQEVSTLKPYKCNEANYIIWSCVDSINTKK